MSCLAGVGAHIDVFLKSAKDCDRLVVLDGCDRNCALKVFEHVKLEPHVYLNLTAQGFSKQPAPMEQPELDRAHVLAVDQLEETGLDSLA